MKNKKKTTMKMKLIFIPHQKDNKTLMNPSKIQVLDIYVDHFKTQYLGFFFKNCRV